MGVYVCVSFMAPVFCDIVLLSNEHFGSLHYFGMLPEHLKIDPANILIRLKVTVVPHRHAYI